MICPRCHNEEGIKMPEKYDYFLEAEKVIRVTLYTCSKCGCKMQPGNRKEYTKDPNRYNTIV